MSDKLDNVILEAVKLRKRYEKKRTMTLGSLSPLFKAIDAANLLPKEPIFCMRGKDRVMRHAVNSWLYFAEKEGTLPATLNEVRGKLADIDRWQNDIKNIRHIKVPT